MAEPAGGETKPVGEGDEGDKQAALEKKRRKELQKQNNEDLKNFSNLFPEKDLPKKKVYRLDRLELL